jgi:hypothetical protein
VQQEAATCKFYALETSCDRVPKRKIASEDIVDTLFPAFLFTFSLGLQETAKRARTIPFCPLLQKERMIPFLRPF